MLNIYSVFDVKAASFGNPFVLVNNALAIRSFHEAAKDPSTNINKYPEDYILYHIGTYDSDTAVIDSFVKPVHLVVASNFFQEA